MRYDKNTYTTTLHLDEDSDGVIHDFIRTIDPQQNAIADSAEYVLESHSVVELAEAIQKILGPDESVMTGYSSTLLSISNMSHPILVVLENNDKMDGRVTEAFRTCIQVTVVGPVKDVKRVLDELEDIFPRKSYTTLSWWFKTNAGTDHMSLVLEHSDKAHDEFYPWIKEGHEEYFDKFLASSSPLLFISGEPGTGKTSFIRSNIARHTMGAYVGYDPALFHSDDMFIGFLSSKRHNIMILEDSETIVLPRDQSGGSSSNSMMSRFLNVSDGLLKNADKKFIFTTNETSFEKIDTALLRPGRCFDFIEFRRLTGDEVAKAAKVAGVNVPDDDKDYSLAELFNQDKKRMVEFKPGFTP